MKHCEPSLSASGQTIEFNFAVSRWLWGGWLALQLPVVALVWFLPGTGSQVLGIALVLSSVFAASRMPGIGWSRRALASAARHADGTWTLTERSGQAAPARLGEGWAAGTNVVFVTWVTSDGVRSAILLQDMVDNLALRRLRALLLISRHT